MNDEATAFPDIQITDLPTNASAGRVTYRPGATLGPRLQFDLQFVVIHKGSAEITIDGGTTISLQPDHVIMLLPDHREYFRFDRDQPTEHSWVYLHFEPLPEVLLSHGGQLAQPLSMTRRMADILELTLTIHSRRSPGDGPILLHLGCAFCHAYLAAAAGASADRPLPAPVWRARRFIEQHFAEVIELADIAAAASVTENHIVRLFRQHLNHTPMRYLWRTRVQRGADLLRDTGLSVSEIAYRVGFSTPYHFSRLVKQHTGLSPKQLRQSHWATD